MRYGATTTSKEKILHISSMKIPMMAYESYIYAFLIRHLFIELNIFSSLTEMISQVKREAEHFKSSVESGKRKRSRGSKDSASAAGGAVEQVATVQKPFVFHQKETEAQIRKRKMVEEVNTSASGIEPEVKKKKLKKKKESEKAAAEKSKSKKGKKLQQETKSSKVRSKEGGERSALLKSVFSGGGGS